MTYLQHKEYLKDQLLFGCKRDDKTLENKFVIIINNISSYKMV